MERMRSAHSIIALAAIVVGGYVLAVGRSRNGVSALGPRLAQIRDLKIQRDCLEQAVAQKQLRLQALEAGKDLDLEFHTRGIPLPGERRSLVAEPDNLANGDYDTRLGFGQERGLSCVQ